MENKAKIDPKRFGILKAYQKGETIPDITAKFRHISRATIYRWIKEFKKGRVCRKTRKPTEEKKACYKTAMDLYGQGLSIAEIQREIKLVSSTTIRRWIMSSDTNSKDLSNDNEVLTSLQASKRAAPAFSLSVSRSPRISIPAKPSSGCG